MQIALAKLAFNFLIMILEKTGILTKVEASAIKDADSFLKVVSHLKTYSAPSDFPTGVNGQ